MSIADLTFLVVEDHAFQRGLLLRMLKNLGAANVIGVADGRSALATFGAPDQSVDIIISDLDMPDMDGMEFIRHLAETGMPVSVIIVSAQPTAVIASVATMAEAYGVKMLGVIEKPVTPTRLAMLIERHEPGKKIPLGPKFPFPSYTIERICAGIRADEFEPYFQPKVALNTGEISGAEALARWRHPQDGMIAPYGFIQALEDNDGIDELTWLMLRKSAAICHAWRTASGVDVTVSVNLSMKSLGDVRLAERVTDVVRGEHLDPHHMILEVTESAVATHAGAALENLSRLRMKGFGLSIDDYGTGYSSMQQLSRIAFTELKVDQSFVANALRQNSAKVILESSIKLAERLNMTSVAEGVETQEQWSLLQELGCDVVQGYFIAKPMDGAAILQWKSARND